MTIKSRTCALGLFLAAFLLQPTPSLARDCYFECTPVEPGEWDPLDPSTYVSDCFGLSCYAAWACAQEFKDEYGPNCDLIDCDHEGEAGARVHIYCTN